MDSGMREMKTHEKGVFLSRITLRPLYSVLVTPVVANAGLLAWEVNDATVQSYRRQVGRLISPASCRGIEETPLWNDIITKCCCAVPAGC